MTNIGVANSIGFAKPAFVISAVICLALLVLSFSGVFAEGIASIWTTDSAGNLKIDFAPFTTVFIRGENFMPNQAVSIDVTRPDSVVETGSTRSNNIGAFVYKYFLADGIEGTYFVEARDKKNYATVTFTDSVKVNLDQWANDELAWQNGNLNSNNSQYMEGEAVPFRLIITGIPGGSHTIHLNYDFTSGGIYAYDYLAKYDLSENPPVTANTSVTLPPGLPTTFSVPSDGFDSVAAHELPQADRHITVYGGSITGIAAIMHDGPVLGNSSADMVVTFNTGGCTADCTLFFLWGGHLASEIEWGSGMGASSISGSPFHMRTQQLDDAGNKNQDRSIQPGAVLPPGCSGNEECSDGVYCNGIETCDTGTGECQPGTAIDCSGLNDQCNLGVCDESQDACIADPKPYSTPCNDGFYCDGADHCNGLGACIALGPAINCTYLNDQCNSGICDEEQDSCIKQALPTGTICNDGLFCNEGEVCIDGTCDNGSAKDCSAFDIFGIGTCDYDPDGLWWTWDYRPPFTSTCNEALDKCTEGDYTITHNEDSKCAECFENADCDDGLYCNGQEVCNLLTHSCELAQEIDCSYLNDQCNNGKCDESTDQCVKQAVENNTPCDDGLYCNVGEKCIDGTCSNGSGKDCSANNIFGIETCDWNPDDIWWTWDYRPLFTSTCNEENNKCTLGDETITHTLDEKCTECMADADCAPTGNQCTENKCIEYKCVVTAKPLSTACEADSSLCTIDHCDGAGACVTFDNVIVPPSEQCADYLCNPQTGLVEPVFDPLSTPCEAEGDLCTIDHCNGAGICETFNIVIVPPAGQCVDYFCNSQTGLVEPIYEQLSTPCQADSDLCTIDHCDGAGECVWKENVLVPEDGKCNSFFCDSADGLVKKNYLDYPLSTPCEADDDACTIDHCDGLGECVFLSNAVKKIETSKAVGTPKITCDYFGEGAEANECWYIISATEISLAVAYEGPNEAQTFYRIRWKEDFDDAWGEWGPLAIYKEPFTIPDDSIHELEYYSGDPICDVNELPHYEIDIVDNQSPEPNKIVGEPKAVWDGLDAVFYDLEQFCQVPENCWRVTLMTPIALDCTDPQPHPVGNEKVCFYVELDADNATNAYCEKYGGNYNANGDGFCCIENAIEEFYFLEESEHNLKYYCTDGLGNKGPIDDEKFKVGGKTFEITLNKKWNLVSVPFMLLDSNPEKVFADIDENIHSVWAYDAVNDKWFVFKSGMPFLSNLTEILPGEGYWISSFDNGVKLVLGGSLLNPVQVPPSKNLEAGWNLIGYYGAEWQGLEQLPYCGSLQQVGSGPVFCTLGSLVDTQQGYPRWASLWSYVNCGMDNAYWIPNSICGEENKMFAGKGYWIEMDVDDIYSIATVCISSGNPLCLGI